MGHLFRSRRGASNQRFCRVLLPNLPFPAFSFARRLPISRLYDDFDVVFIHHRNMADSSATRHEDCIKYRSRTVFSIPTPCPAVRSGPARTIPPGKGCAPGRLREGVRAHIRMMDRPQIETAVIELLIGGGSATFTALMLGYVAHYDFGLSRQEIRTPAVLGAVIIAVPIAVEFLGKRLRKP